MRKRYLLPLALLALAGCQENESPPRAAAPSLAGPVYYEPAKPLPGGATRRYDYEYLERYERYKGYTYGEQPAAHPPARSLPGKNAPKPQPNTSSAGTVAVTAQPQWAPSASPRPWRWIVIHHSDTSCGSAASFDRYHRLVRHWDELGYHFVIDNGNGGGDGLVEVGPRWTKQKWGAHAGVAEFNEYGIGICLVGDFNKTQPTAAQMRSLAQLSAWLMKTYHISPDHLIGHRDAKRTECPGRYMNIAAVRQLAAGIAGIPLPEAPLACAELMYAMSEAEASAPLQSQGRR